MRLADKIRRGSAEHESLSSYVQSRLTMHRQQLESTDVPIDKVPALRARIHELKALLDNLDEEIRHE